MDKMDFLITILDVTYVASRKPVPDASGKAIPKKGGELVLYMAPRAGILDVEKFRQILFSLYQRDDIFCENAASNLGSEQAAKPNKANNFGGLVSKFGSTTSLVNTPTVSSEQFSEMFSAISSASYRSVIAYITLNCESYDTSKMSKILTFLNYTLSNKGIKGPIVLHFIGIPYFEQHYRPMKSLAFTSHNDPRENNDKIMLNFLDLPLEIFEKVLTYLPVSDHIQFRRTSMCVTVRSNKFIDHLWNKDLRRTTCKKDVQIIRFIINVCGDLYMNRGKKNLVYDALLYLHESMTSPNNGKFIANPRMLSRFAMNLTNKCLYSYKTESQRYEAKILYVMNLIHLMKHFQKFHIHHIDNPDSVYGYVVAIVDAKVLLFEFPDEDNYARIIFGLLFGMLVDILTVERDDVNTSASKMWNTDNALYGYKWSRNTTKRRRDKMYMKFRILADPLTNQFLRNAFQGVKDLEIPKYTASTYFNIWIRIDDRFSKRNSFADFHYSIVVDGCKPEPLRLVTDEELEGFDKEFYEHVSSDDDHHWDWLWERLSSL